MEFFKAGIQLSTIQSNRKWLEKQSLCLAEQKKLKTIVKTKHLGHTWHKFNLHINKNELMVATTVQCLNTHDRAKPHTHIILIDPGWGQCACWVQISIPSSIRSSLSLLGIAFAPPPCCCCHSSSLPFFRQTFPSTRMLTLNPQIYTESETIFNACTMAEQEPDLQANFLQSHSNKRQIASWACKCPSPT